MSASKAEYPPLRWWHSVPEVRHDCDIPSIDVAVGEEVRYYWTCSECLQKWRLRETWRHRWETRIGTASRSWRWKRAQGLGLPRGK